MRLQVNRSFLAEIEQFDLRFTCRDCSFHVQGRDVCAHAWPDALHREAPALAADGSADVVFCKEFELA